MNISEMPTATSESFPSHCHLSCPPQQKQLESHSVLTPMCALSTLLHNGHAEKTLPEAALLYWQVNRHA